MRKFSHLASTVPGTEYTGTPCTRSDSTVAQRSRQEGEVEIVSRVEYVLSSACGSGFPTLEFCETGACRIEVCKELAYLETIYEGCLLLICINLN